ncbi:SAGA complex subunit Sgf73 [Microsporum ferrugineum]
MMTSNGAGGKVLNLPASSDPSFVDASGYKFKEKDFKSKVKVKKPSAKLLNGLTEQNSKDEQDSRGSSSPILPEMDSSTMAAFPTGKPRETKLETVICKHCKKPALKQSAAEHIRACLKAKQEKARKKKEAREAKLTKDKPVDKDGNEDAEGEVVAMKGQKSAKKSAADDAKKGKKRKVDVDEDKEPKKKKKKDEPKPKVPKPKGPVDVEKQCGVILPNGAQCARSLTCKSHSMGAKRAVPGRSLPYDMLLQAYQKKNQARQQKAAIDANAPIHDDIDGNGPIDSDEEKDAVMAGLARSRPQPLVTHPLMSTQRKYHLIRMKEMFSQALGGGGAGLFSGDSIFSGRSLFSRSESPPFASSGAGNAADISIQQPQDGPRKSSLSQQAVQNRTAQAGVPVKPVTAS